MNTISLLEKLPMRELNYLYTLDESSLKSLLAKDDEKDKNGDKNRFPIFRNYIKTAIKSGGQLTTNYKNKIYGGRMSASPSIQNIFSSVRALLFRDTTTDLDMANCHPTIFRYIASKYNLNTPRLDYFINNRDIHYSEFINRKEGKDAYIKSLNKDKIVSKKDNTDLYYNFDVEIKKNMNKIIKLENYKNIVDNIVFKKEHNHGGATMNHIMNCYENKIINTCYDYLTTRNLKVAAFMFDGLLIEGNYYDDIDLLNDLTSHIESIYPGLNMKWAYKKHDTLLQVPEDFIEFEIPNEPINDIVDYPEDNIPKNNKQHKLTNKKSDAEAAVIFIELMGQNIKKEDGIIYMFNENTFLWESGDDMYTYHYHSFGEQLIFYYMVGELVKNINYSGSLVNVKNSYVFVKSKVSETNFLNAGYEKALSLMLFDDGIYDFKRGMLFPKEFYDSSYVFKFKINRKFSHNRDTKLENEIKKKLFIDPFKTPSDNMDEEDILKGDSTKTGQFLLESLANALLGNYKHKKFYFCCGLSNSGKGIICEALLKTFENYVGTYNGNNLLSSREDGEEAKKNMWMACLLGKKIMFCNEVSMNKKKIDVNTIKKLSSGGDEIDYRKNFKDGQKLINRSNMLFFCNEIPAFSNPTDTGIKNRCEYINFERTFVNELPKDATEDNSYYSLADYNLKSDLAKPEYISAFFHLLAETCLKVYKNENGNETYSIIQPMSVSVEKELQLADTNGCFSINFWKLYEPATITDEVSLVNITDLYNKTYSTNFICRQLSKMMKMEIKNIGRKEKKHSVYITNIKLITNEGYLISDELD